MSLIRGPDRQLTRSALGLKVLVGLLTGHITLNKHVSVMKVNYAHYAHHVVTSEEEETASHFLGSCTPAS